MVTTPTPAPRPPTPPTPPPLPPRPNPPKPKDESGETVEEFLKRTGQDPANIDLNKAANDLGYTGGGGGRSSYDGGGQGNSVPALDVTKGQNTQSNPTSDYARQQAEQRAAQQKAQEELAKVIAYQREQYAQNPQQYRRLQGNQIGFADNRTPAGQRYNEAITDAANQKLESQNNLPKQAMVDKEAIAKAQIEVRDKGYSGVNVKTLFESLGATNGRIDLTPENLTVLNKVAVESYKELNQTRALKSDIAPQNKIIQPLTNPVIEDAKLFGLGTLPEGLVKKPPTPTDTFLGIVQMSPTEFQNTRQGKSAIAAGNVIYAVGESVVKGTGEILTFVSNADQMGSLEKRRQKGFDLLQSPDVDNVLFAATLPILELKKLPLLAKALATYTKLGISGATIAQGFPLLAKGLAENNPELFYSGVLQEVFGFTMLKGSPKEAVKTERTMLTDQRQGDVLMTVEKSRSGGSLLTKIDDNTKAVASQDLINQRLKVNKIYEELVRRGNQAAARSISISDAKSQVAVSTSGILISDVLLARVRPKVVTTAVQAETVVGGEVVPVSKSVFGKSFEEGVASVQETGREAVQQIALQDAYLLLQNKLQRGEFVDVPSTLKSDFRQNVLNLIDTADFQNYNPQFLFEPTAIIAERKVNIKEKATADIGLISDEKQILFGGEGFQKSKSKVQGASVILKDESPIPQLTNKDFKSFSVDVEMVNARRVTPLKIGGKFRIEDAEPSAVKQSIPQVIPTVMLESETLPVIRIEEFKKEKPTVIGTLTMQDKVGKTRSDVAVQILKRESTLFRGIEAVDTRFKGGGLVSKDLTGKATITERAQSGKGARDIAVQFENLDKKTSNNIGDIRYKLEKTLKDRKDLLETIDQAIKNTEKVQDLIYQEKINSIAMRALTPKQQLKEIKRQIKAEEQLKAQLRQFSKKGLPDEVYYAKTKAEAAEIARRTYLKERDLKRFEAFRDLMDSKEQKVRIKEEPRMFNEAEQEAQRVKRNEANVRRSEELSKQMRKNIFSDEKKLRQKTDFELEQERIKQNNLNIERSLKIVEEQKKERLLQGNQEPIKFKTEEQIEKERVLRNEENIKRSEDMLKDQKERLEKMGLNYAKEKKTREQLKAQIKKARIEERLRKKGQKESPRFDAFKDLENQGKQQTVFEEKTETKQERVLTSEEAKRISQAQAAISSVYFEPSLNVRRVDVFPDLEKPFARGRLPSGLRTNQRNEFEQRQTPAQRIKQDNESRNRSAIISRNILGDLTKNNVLADQAPRSREKVSSVSALDVNQISKQKVDIVSAVKLQTTQQQVLSPVFFQKTDFGFDFPIDLIAEPIKIIKESKEKKAKKKLKGFDVEAKRRGKFTRINVEPLTFEEAKRQGSLVTDNSAARTFRIKEAQGFASERATAYQFRAQRYTQKGTQFVQKTKFAISSKGEKREITEKGIATLRLKSKTNIFK